MLGKIPDYSSALETLTDLRQRLEVSLARGHTNTARVAIVRAGAPEPTKVAHPIFNRSELFKTCEFTEADRTTHFADVAVTMKAYFERTWSAEHAASACKDLQCVLDDPQTPLFMLEHCNLERFIMKHVEANVAAMADDEVMKIRLVPGGDTIAEARRALVSFRGAAVKNGIANSIAEARAAAFAAQAPRERFDYVKEVETAARGAVKIARDAEDLIELRPPELTEFLATLMRVAQNIDVQRPYRGMAEHTRQRFERMASDYSSSIIAGLDALLAGIYACEVPAQRWLH